ncbi:MAG TPA: DUF1028 domain-containing protein [bacterium (Candidatus Stahlbacteria)]|nr:DUF1028 domain-containing protein [Candidatus Stahlbacteria bacterium]
MKLFVLFVVILALCTGVVPTSYADVPSIGTFSIVAYDSITGELGVAVESKFLAVGAVVPYAEAGVGAIATQAWGNTTYGPDGLALLKMGISPEQVINILTSKDTNRTQRQLGIVDAKGRAAAYTGEDCLYWAGHIVGHHYAVQGNILAGEQVVKEMAQAFEQTDGTLAERLLAALEAGQGAGGDRRGRQSAALLVVRKYGGYSGYNDRYIDLRVDDNPEPIKELKRLFRLHERFFQADAHVRFGVEFLKQGQRAKAEHEFELALAIADKYPDDANLQNEVAWAFATNDVRLDDALRLAKRAVELAPKDANIWDTLGETYFRRAEYKEAIEAESRAVELDPQSKLFKKKLEDWKKKAKE